MIVKFLKNNGGGSAGATIDYMLGKDRDREGAILLSGDPDLTARIADNLDLKHRYTVGVLSFEEKNIHEKAKQEIMQSFEKTLLAGLERDQYDITWIEHRDKDRLELNFIIPKVDLHSGKSMNPYFDKVDRDLVNAWKNVTNHQYGLTNPNDPRKKQSHIIANNLPKDKKELSESIGNSLFIELSERHAQGKSSNRQDVIQHIESLGLEVARITPTAISIKAPDGGRNIRLKGEMYEESFGFSEGYRQQKQAEGEQFRAKFDEGAEAERGQLSELTGKKRTFNENRFRRKHEQHREQNRELGGAHTEQDRGRLQGNGEQARGLDKSKGESRQGENLDTNPNDHFSNKPNNPNWGEFVARQVNTRQTARTSRDTAEHRANATTSSSIGESGDNSKRRQINLDNSQERQEIQSRNGNKQQQAEFKTGIKPRFENPFNKDGGGEQLQHTELLKHPQAQQEQLSDHEQSTSSRLRELINTARNIANYCYRTYSEFRERIAGGDAIKSDAKQRESDTAGVNQQVKQRESNIEQHKSGATGANNWLERADFALDNTDREIDEIKQGVISADARIRGRIEPQQLEKQVKNMESRGMER